MAVRTCRLAGPPKQPINLVSPPPNQGSRTNTTSLLQQDHFQANTLFLVGCISPFNFHLLQHQLGTKAPLNSRAGKNAAISKAKLLLLVIFMIIGTILSI